VLARRHAIGVLLSIELMFNAVNLAVVSIAWSRGLIAGVVLVLFGIAITVAEIAVGLALVLLASRVRKTVILDDLSELKG
jgi:NADH-quinone oxidoreductase subunit K